MQFRSVEGRYYVIWFTEQGFWVGTGTIFAWPQDFASLLELKNLQMMF